MSSAEFAQRMIKVNHIMRKWVCGLNSSKGQDQRVPIHLGPVVQSVVSLTTSLRVISLTVLADSIYIILIFFADKM